MLVDFGPVYGYLINVEVMKYMCIYIIIYIHVVVGLGSKLPGSFLQRPADHAPFRAHTAADAKVTRLKGVAKGLQGTVSLLPTKMEPLARQGDHTHESMQQDMLWCWNWHELKGYVHILQELLQ